MTSALPSYQCISRLRMRFDGQLGRVYMEKVLPSCQRITPLRLRSNGAGHDESPVLHAAAFALCRFSPLHRTLAAYQRAAPSLASLARYCGSWVITATDGSGEYSTALTLSARAWKTLYPSWARPTRVRP